MKSHFHCLYISKESTSNNRGVPFPLIFQDGLSVWGTLWPVFAALRHMLLEMLMGLNGHLKVMPICVQETDQQKCRVVGAPTQHKLHVF